VDIILEDGTTLTINNNEELRQAYAGCGDSGRGGNSGAGKKKRETKHYQSLRFVRQ